MDDKKRYRSMSNLKKKKYAKIKRKKERNSIEIVKTLSVFATSRSLSNRCPLTLLPARWRVVRNEQDSCDRSRYLNRTNYIIEIVSFFCFFFWFRSFDTTGTFLFYFFVFQFSSTRGNKKKRRKNWSLRYFSPFFLCRIDDEIVGPQLLELGDQPAG